MIHYDDIKNRGYDTLNQDYNADYIDGISSYYSDPKLVQDPRLLQHVSLASLGFSIDRLKREMLGLGQVIDPNTNKPYPDVAYQEAIEEAVTWAEQILDIVIRPRVVKELDDYNRTDYMNYGYIRTNARPILQVDDSRLIWNNATVLHIARSWLRINHRFGNFRLNPTAIMAQTSGGILQSPTLLCFSGNFQGGFPFGNDNFAPGMIGTTYLAGFLPRDPRDKGINKYYYIPYDLIKLVMLRAGVWMITLWGRSVLTPGIASENVSIDGISTGVNSTQSPFASGATADVKLLESQIPPLIKALKSYYGYNLGIIS